MNQRDWDQLLHDDGPWLARYVGQRVPTEAVEDVLQEVWASFWAAGSHYCERGQRRAYLRTLADRRAADWHRAGSPADPGALSPPDDHEPDFTRHLLQQCGVAAGSLVWRRVIDDWTLSDLARQFGLPLGTVKSRLHHESQALRRQLSDWHHERRGDDAACDHANSDVWGVVPCAACRRERAAWHRLAAVGAPDAPFQLSYFTWDSLLGVSLDCQCHYPWRHEPQRSSAYGSARADFGAITLLRNARGESLLGRVHRTPSANPPLWTYALYPRHGSTLRIRTHGRAADAERIGALEIGRHHVELRLDISYPDGGSGATVVELPATLAVEQAYPEPHHASIVHGRQVLVWRDCAGLPQAPVVQARRR